jgi:hypothetical protein
MTFQILAAFSGHGDLPQTKTKKQAKSKPEKKLTKNIDKKPKLHVAQPSSKAPVTNKESPIGLTVRIEINLPADGNQETYDRIFKSIRENLLNVEFPRFHGHSVRLGHHSLQLKRYRGTIPQG